MEEESEAEEDNHDEYDDDDDEDDDVLLIQLKPVKRNNNVVMVVDPTTTNEAVKNVTADLVSSLNLIPASVMVSSDPTALPTSDPALLNVLSRDEMAKKEEDGGKLDFRVITNDGTAEHSIQLMTLKNIFSRQLPKMPKEYIVRLVFDRKHKSMVIVKEGNIVVGGICYRPYYPQAFAEIAFCAITASEQVKGYGTRLMNHVKEFVKTEGIDHFLTYADNYAIGYFRKQGFSKQVGMDRQRWFGYIKDYDGGTLMECAINTHVNYLNIPGLVQKQREFLLAQIRKRSHSHIVYPGLKEQLVDGRIADIFTIPGISTYIYFNA